MMSNFNKQMKKRIIYQFLYSVTTAIFFISACTPNTPSIPPTVIPNSPTHLTASVASNNQIDLHWTDNSSDETGYKIQRKTSGNNFVDIDSTAANINTYSDVNVIVNTMYTYRVCAYNSAGNSNQFTNEDSAIIIFNVIVLPTVNTIAANTIDTMHATLNGEVSNEGGATVTVRGICWSTSPNPTSDLSTSTIEGAGLGSFSSMVSNLLPNTTYHFRAYATNSVGTAYGGDMTVITHAILSSVTIGTQVWSLKNLDVTRYRNGDTIHHITDAQEWKNTTEGAWCWYNNDSATYAAKYGRLYNYYAVSDPRGLAPAGWHVPNDYEWNTLIKYIDANADTVCDYCTSSQTAGGAMKPPGYVIWLSPNTGATNSSRFTAMPGGFRTELGTFTLVTQWANWWSATEYAFDNNRAYYHYILSNNATANRYHIDKHYGNSVRLIKN